LSEAQPVTDPSLTKTPSHPKILFFLVFKIKKPKKQREKDLFNPPQSIWVQRSQKKSGGGLREEMQNFEHIMRREEQEKESYYYYYYYYYYISAGF